MYTVYKLYSNNKDQYYVGYTSDTMEERLRKHNTNHKGFTGKVRDWKIVYTEVYDNKLHAMHRESEIKS